MRTPAFVLILAAALAAFVAAIGAAPARGGGDTVVVALNAKDGSFLYRVKLDLRRVGGETVDESNAAVAVASCSSCETVAVSIQALLVFSDPQVVTPTNLAFAMNLECAFCNTLASAYQFYVQAGRPVHFTSDGNRRIAEIRRALHALRHAGLTIWEIQAEVDRLAHELQRVLEEELVAAGKPGA
jgi:putative peptide zinc metalloprotease protein